MKRDVKAVNPRALLIAIMEPPPAMEEEFNEWYDLEHIPQMRDVPGIDTATRFLAVEGWPRYLAVYDLAEFTVLRSPAYRAMTGSGFTAWSRRILSRVRGWQRLTFNQVAPGPATMNSDCGALLLFVFKGEVDLAAVVAKVAGEPGVVQVRAFGPGEDVNDGAALLVESGAIAPLANASASTLRALEDAHAVPAFSGTYLKYWRTDPLARFHSLEAGR